MMATLGPEVLLALTTKSVVRFRAMPVGDAMVPPAGGGIVTMSGSSVPSSP